MADKNGINMKSSLILTGGLALLAPNLLQAAGSKGHSAEEKPNVIFMYADDLG